MEKKENYYFVNIKTNWRHSTLEFLIKKFDSSQDMSRAAVFEREVRAAQGIKNWKEIQLSLSDLEKSDDIPVFTSLQARISDEIFEILAEVKKEILKQLGEDGSLKVLQTQYMVQLLQANYLQILKQNKLAIKSDVMVEENINLPEMASLFTEMMLKDKDCEELRQIRKILVDWRNA